MNAPANNFENEHRLPSPQGIALAIIQACQKDEVSVIEVSRLVQSDPALTGRLLQLANSASSGGRPVASAMDAVSRIGLQTVRRLALSFSLVDQYKDGACAAFDYAGYWSHSLFMATAMQEVGALLKLGSPDELFSCGLLARVGCLALATAYPDAYEQILKRDLRTSALLDLEQKTLRTDHIQLSALLHAKWGLPAVLWEPMRFHEDPAAAQFPHGSRPWNLANTLHLTLRLADFIVRPRAEDTSRVTELSLLAGSLGIADEDFSRCVDSIVRSWTSWGAELNIVVAPVEPFATFSKATTRPDQEANLGWLRVLIVEDDPIVRRLLEKWLEVDCHYTVKTANNGREALTSALDFKPHVVMTDWQMPVMDGLELCRALRATEWGESIYVLMLTSADAEGDLVNAFEAGVDDYLTKPIKMRALSARLKAAWRYVRLRDAWERDHERLTRAAEDLALTNRRLQHAALTDPLTELANRRAGLEALSKGWGAAARYGHKLSLIAIDIDHFKKINDVHGHATGDDVLQHLSQNLRAAARQGDTVCRWGGEEFLVICPNMGSREAASAAERLLKAGSSVAVDAKRVAITVSIGVASWHSDMQSPDHLLAEADKALYEAKQGGRNRIVVSNSSGQSE
jgi:diguanylate cyclase (GGDEF)-like protein